MKEVIIKGVAMIAASEVYKEIERLETSRRVYREAAAEKQTELNRIRAALHGAPDGDLISLAAATFAGCEMFERLAGDGVVTRQMIMRAVKGSGND